MLNIIKNTINRVFASGVDSDASAFITATGLSGTTQKSAITTLVKDLKSSGLWSKMKAVYPMVTDNYNLLSYSEDFANGYWIQSGATVTANSTVAPNGTTTADIINTTSTGYIYTTGNYNGITQTISCYVKKKTDSIAYIGIYDTVDKGFWFNLDTGAITQTTGTISNQTLTSVGNGWYRASFTFTNGAATTYIPSPTPRVASGSTTRGTDLYIWGAQLENGGTLSAYQPILTTPSAFMASQMKYNLKDARDLDAAFRLTWSGGWTYSATGATPNGTNAYADTKFIPNNNGLTVNDNSISYYSRTSAANGATQYYEIGSSEVLGITDLYSLFTRRSTDLAGYDSGDYTKNRSSFTNTNGSGFYIGKVNSDLTSKFYKNGILSATKSITNQAGLSSFSVFLGGFNEANTVVYYSPKQVAFASLGNGLSDNDALVYNQIIEKFQVALSRGIQAAQSFYYNSAYSNEANTYLYSTQITGTTQVSAINTLINGLKANNLWTKMKAVYPFVTDNINLLGYTTTWVTQWTGGGVGTTGQADPFGGNTATLGNGNEFFQSYSYTNGVRYNLSIYAKAAGTSTFTFGTDVASGCFCTFNLSTLAITNSAGYTGSITSIGNNWYRCSVNFTYNVGGTFAPYFDIKPSGGTMYFAAPQLELGASASTYQPIVTTPSSYMSNQMKFNLFNPQDTDAAFRLAFSGGWTYSTNGAQPNGTNGYADTKLVPSAAISSVNSNSLGYYSGSNLAETSIDPVNVGSTISGTQAMNILKSNASIYSRLNGDALTYVTSIMKGFFVATRPSSSVANLFFNGNKVTTITPNGSLPNYSVLIGTTNFGSTPYAQGYVRNDFRFVFIADGFNDTESTLLYQLVQQLQTDLSRQV